jgi:hypothetical protein
LTTAIKSPPQASRATARLFFSALRSISAHARGGEMENNSFTALKVGIFRVLARL